MIRKQETKGRKSERVSTIAGAWPGVARSLPHLSWACTDGEAMADRKEGKRSRGLGWQWGTPVVKRQMKLL